jgi:DNA-binding MarR family transcriptional regulator
VAGTTPRKPVGHRAKNGSSSASQTGGRRPARPSPQERVFLAVVRAAGTLTARAADLVKRFGLTPAQYNVLRILRGAGPGGLMCSQISERMITRDSDITRLLDRLERSGWVARERQDTDRRTVVTSITNEGLALLGELDEPLAAHHRETFAALTPAELETLRRLLDTVGGT